jgi:hypothetical protein
MATPKIPYPDQGQGMSFFSACCPSHPLGSQTSASAAPPDCALCETLVSSQASLVADGRAW